MLLSEDLRKLRSDRPDEWTMDRFIQEAIRLEVVEQNFNSLQQAKHKTISLCIGCSKESCSQRSEIESCPVTYCVMHQAKQIRAFA